MKINLLRTILILCLLTSISLVGFDSPNLIIFGTSDIIELPDPYLVTADSDVVSTDSSFVIDRNDNIHLVWAEQITSSYQIYYKKWIASTQIWTSPQNVSTESDNWLHNPRIAIDSRDIPHIVWEDSTDNDGADSDYDVFYKTQVFKTWGDTVVISDASTLDSRNPSIAIDSKDNIYICWDDKTNDGSNGDDMDIMYKNYNSTSRTWVSSQTVSIESTVDSIAPNLAIDSRDNINFVWYESDTNTIWDIIFKKWYVSSQIWGKDKTISTESTDALYNPEITIDKHDNIHVVWTDTTDYDDADEDSDIFYKQWVAADQIWGGTEVVSVEDATSPDPPDSTSGSTRIAIDSKGNAHVTWVDKADYNIAGIDLDIFYRLRTASTNLWGDTGIVSITSYRGSLSPDIAIDSGDYFHVIWTDYTDMEGSGVDADLFWLSGHPRTVTETLTETETETETKTETETNLENQTGFVTSTMLIEETTTVTEAKSELPLGLLPFLSALVLIPIIVRKFKK